jgi:hypothetical protein
MNIVLYGNVYLYPRWKPLNLSTLIVVNPLLNLCNTPLNQVAYYASNSWHVRVQNLAVALNAVLNTPSINMQKALKS